MILLDTHVLVRYLMGDKKLRDFLTDIRDFQIQNKAYVEPYVTDLD